MKNLLLTICLLSTTLASATDWQHKVSEQVFRQLNSVAEIELILRIESPDIPKQASNTRIEKIKNKVAQLKLATLQSQQPVIEYLTAQGISHQSFWISNDILIQAKANQVPEILKMSAVKYAFSNEKVGLNLPRNTEKSTQAVAGIEWNVNMVQAPAVWSLGYTGQNIVIAGQDTGYQWDHPLLIDQYRGWDGQNADHNYNWHDGITSPNVDCGNAPCDDHSHGSHTMGTMIGDDGGSNQTGVAPGAKWMGCRNMNQGDGSPASYTACYQWFLEPTDLNGENPNSAMAPHIINNSWACPDSEGCNFPEILEPIVNNVVDAGILVVSSAGNSGPGCNTVNTPSAIYAATLTVGSTTNTDVISGFSSRGSVTVDGSNRMKPDLSAPGSSVRSANNTGGFTTMSGTSMASPNAAGVAALIMSANPILESDPKLVKRILSQTAVVKTTAENCGGVSGSNIPNNTYGFGRIDALAAVNQALDIIYFDDFE